MSLQDFSQLTENKTLNIKRLILVCELLKTRWREEEATLHHSTLHLREEKNIGRGHKGGRKGKRKYGIEVKGVETEGTKEEREGKRRNTMKRRKQ